MKRLLPLLPLMVLAHASSASAVAFYFGTPSTTGPLDPGDPVSIPLYLDTEGATDLTGLFVSVAVDPDLLTFVDGASPPYILFNFSSYEDIARVSNPLLVAGDWPGVVRAAAYNTIDQDGSGTSAGAELVATLNFIAANGPGGIATLEAFLAPGDQVEASSLDVSDDVALGSSAEISVNAPEPAVALQLGIGVLGVGLLGRRRRLSRPS